MACGPTPVAGLVRAGGTTGASVDGREDTSVRLARANAPHNGAGVGVTRQRPMDFRRRRYETACVTNPCFLRRARPIPIRLGILSACVGVLAGCDQIKSRLYPPPVDAGWQADSTFLAQSPTLLLRAVRTGGGAQAVPIASVGTRGVRALSLTGRGWRALDVQMLYAGRSFVPYRGSVPLSPVTSQRGMWEGPPLDSVPGCRLLHPAAAVPVPEGVDLFTSGATPLRVSSNRLGDGELQAVLNVVATLVAPTAGVSLSQMAKYRRTVAVVGTGATASPTIVVSFEDPEELPDSATRLAERPRQLILVLDKGVYGYRPSLTLKDVTPARMAPRRRFLGALDADGDGKSELYFGLSERIERGELVTYSYRFVGDTWIADWEYVRARCLG